MAGLRESKKLATRQAISDAAAGIVLERGAEALTVANVAASAGVSARTFHNYFPSVDEALFSFAHDVLEIVGEQIKSMPPQLSTTEIFEQIIIEGLGERGIELRSVTSLFRISELLENRMPRPQNKDELNAFGAPILEALMERNPQRSQFEMEVVLHACAAAGVTACEHIMGTEKPIDAEQAERTVGEAFDALRGIH